MILKKGNFLEGPLDLNIMYIATGNNIIKFNGELVMGKGSALEIKKRFPHCPKEFANIIKLRKAKDYYFIPLSSYSKVEDCSTTIWGIRNVGLFQTKRNYKDNSDIELIKDSIMVFSLFVTQFRPDLTYRLPFPGISNGGLQDKKEEILEMLKVLPDNVEIWELQ